MLKRILLITLIVTVSGVVFFSLLSANVYYNSSLDFAKNQLTRYMEEFEEDEPFDEAGAAALSEKLFGARVTYILFDGTVVADSDGAASDYPNHLGRQEVSAALGSGAGFAVRSSISAESGCPDFIRSINMVTRVLTAAESFDPTFMTLGSVA